MKTAEQNDWAVSGVDRMTQNIGYDYNDGGRAASGRKGKCRDCVVRALAILTRKPYDEIYRAAAKHNQTVSGGARTARSGVYKVARNRLFADYGLQKVKLPKGPRPTFAEAYHTYGNCIVSTVGHVCAITGGVLKDTFDGRFYDWTDDLGRVEERERKAQSVWVWPDAPKVRPKPPPPRRLPIEGLSQ